MTTNHDYLYINSDFASAESYFPQTEELKPPLGLLPTPEVSSEVEEFHECLNGMFPRTFDYASDLFKKVETNNYLEKALSDHITQEFQLTPSGSDGSPYEFCSDTPYQAQTKPLSSSSQLLPVGARSRTLTWMSTDYAAGALYPFTHNRAQTFSGESLYPISLPPREFQLKTKDSQVAFTPATYSTKPPFYSQLVGSASESLFIPLANSLKTKMKTAKAAKIGKKTAAPKKNHRCKFPNCMKAFGSRSHLERHERIHTKVKNFRCPVKSCNALFNRLDNMRQHYRAHERKMESQSSYLGASL